VHRMSLRTARDAPARGWGAAAARARRAVGRAVPQGAKDAVVRAALLDRPSPAALERLRHHYAYWREKWGWDPLNPDVDEVRRRYGETEVCWAYDEGRRAAGEAILAHYASG
ncbi:MAG TPA: hypothetical protein VNB64_12395, partial [Solirubrobacteraceae bacterium]|nr:hypothetical protein [Solirubrobacteraceae bacterium]